LFHTAGAYVRILFGALQIITEEEDDDDDVTQHFHVTSKLAACTVA